MRRLLWLVAVLVIVLVGASASVRLLSHDAEIWHLDPAVAERTGRDNDYLLAPPGVRPDVDRVLEVRDLSPRAHLFLFDAIARNAPRTSIVGGSLDDLHITYVQRSLVFAFPDYISVKSVPVDNGSALIVFARSRLGYSDMGVNRERVERWLAQMGDL